MLSLFLPKIRTSSTRQMTPSSPAQKRAHPLLEVLQGTRYVEWQLIEQYIIYTMQLGWETL